MQYTTGFVLALAGLAAAQSSSSVEAVTASSVTVSAATSSSTAASGCGSSIDLIIQSCLGTYTPQLQACAANDWDCLCAQSTNIMTCYNNCPSDPNAFGAQQTETSYCNAAKAYGSSSSAASGSQTATGTASGSTAAAATASETSSAATSVASGFATATSSGSAGSTASSSGSAASSSSSSSGASAQYAPAGLAAVFGLVALL